MMLLKPFLFLLIIIFSINATGQQKTVHLEIGDSIILKIYSKPLWNETDLEVRAGETYIFLAKGEWTDWYIVSEADGYEMWHMNLFRSYKRSPENKWFALMGSIGKTDTIFLIGRMMKKTFMKTGKLYLFANDVRGFYFNNKGSIIVTIRRIADEP